MSHNSGREPGQGSDQCLRSTNSRRRSSQSDICAPGHRDSAHSTGAYPQRLPARDAPFASEPVAQTVLPAPRLRNYTDRTSCPLDRISVLRPVRRQHKHFLEAASPCLANLHLTDLWGSPPGYHRPRDVLMQRPAISVTQSGGLRRSIWKRVQGHVVCATRTLE